MKIQTEGLLQDSVVALGTFDGVHLGHQAVIRAAVDAAKELHKRAVIYTFRMPPRNLLGKERASLLTPPSEKAALIEALGADIYYEEPLTPSFLSLSPTDFIREVLLKKLGACYVVAGYNYHFGKGGKGDVSLLTEEGKRLGFTAVSVPEVTKDGKAVSSTAIREALEKGNAEEAALLLGRKYRVTGTVEHGRQIGRTLGFPTLNLSLPKGAPTIRRGVYEGEVLLRSKRYKAMINVGTRPTFRLHALTLEAHLLGFSEDAYGEEIAVYFHSFLRPETAFASPGLLTEQMKKDREEIEKKN